MKWKKLVWIVFAPASNVERAQVPVLQDAVLLCERAN